MALYSQEIERLILAGITKNPKSLADVEAIVSSKDFHIDIHQYIYEIAREFILEGKDPNHVLIAQKLKNAGVNFKHIQDVGGYIESVLYKSPSHKATVSAASELKTLSIRRSLMESMKNVANYINNESSKDSISEILSKVDSLYSENISLTNLDSQPELLFENIEEILLERAENPVDNVGILTPYNCFNDLYGGLRAGNIYAIASRGGQGKSTWLSSLSNHISKHQGINVLYLDTEMSTMEQQFRVASSVSGVPLWYLETGNWKKNLDMKKKVEGAFHLLKNPNYYHYPVGNRNIDEVLSIIRRWHMSKVGKGNPSVIVYDYVKLTGEKLGANWAEHQAIGLKIDKLKKISEEVQAPLLTAIQLNRSGENQNRRGADVVDDSSAIALSDRLQWIGSFIAIFRRKTDDEYAIDTPEFGTHKLIPTKTRWQGKEARGHQDSIVRTIEQEFRGRNGQVEIRPVQRRVPNFLNFDIRNFHVEERGSLEDIVRMENLQMDLNDGGEEDTL